MIRLHRPAPPPVLQRRAAEAMRDLWAAWQEGQAPEANADIYNAPEVKQTLRQAQHNKCAYCETVNPSSHDVVEHYRPKDGWRQRRGDPLQKPQYFWLAYDWENLLFACDLCNDRGHKENLFPLANPAERASPENPHIDAELPLLLNPYGPDNPEAHITWDRDVPRQVDDSPFGAETISVLRLDRDDLRSDHRRGHLLDLEASLARIERLPADSSDRGAFVEVLRALVRDDAKWSAMVRANFGSRIAAL